MRLLDHSACFAPAPSVQAYAGSHPNGARRRCETLFALTAFAKNERADLSQEDRNTFRRLTKLLVETYNSASPDSLRLEQAGAGFRVPMHRGQPAVLVCERVTVGGTHTPNVI
jgi:hypothetical protein